MKSRSNLPLRLQIIAVVFLLYGIASVADFIRSVASGHRLYDMGMLGIPIFFGLRHLSNEFRLGALFYLSLRMIGCILIFIYSIHTASENTHLQFFGVSFTHLPPVVLSIVTSSAIQLDLWQFWVLNSAPVRALFGSKEYSLPTNG